MALNKFIPLSPDPNIVLDSDATVARFGHLNTIVDYVNNNAAGLQLEGDGLFDATLKRLKDSVGSLSSLQISTTSITNPGGGSVVTNAAFGKDALLDNTTGEYNTAFGWQSGWNITTGIRNTILGSGSFMTLITGSDNTVVGSSSATALSSGSVAEATVVGTGCIAHTGSTVLGAFAQSTGTNQFVVGSTTVNAGTVDTAAVTPTKRWKVKINGVDYYIALEPA